MSLVPLNRLLPYSFQQLDLGLWVWRRTIKADRSTYALPRYNPDHRLAGRSSHVGRVVSIPRRGQGRGTLEYVFEAGEQNSPNAVTKEKVAEIAADFMTTFYHVQVGALETQEFRTKPVPFWLVCFSDTVKGPLRQLFFVVLLPDGTVVVPMVHRDPNNLSRVEQTIPSRTRC
jgi:hypothetical protein